MESEWCAVELVGGKEVYLKYTDELKEIAVGKYEGVMVTLSDVCVAARGPNGTTVVLKRDGLIQSYRNQMHIRVSLIQLVTSLDGSGDWAKGLTEVEGGKDVALVHRPELPKPESGIVGVGMGAVAPPPRG